MAETYHVGQYRYIGDIDGKNPCTQLLNTYPTNSSENNGDTNNSNWLEPVYTDANYAIGEGTVSNCCYQDVLIRLSEKEDFVLSKEDVFCIELSIARMNVPINYTLKLVSSKEKDSGFKHFEVLKKFKVSNYTSSELKPVKVALYCSSNKKQDYAVRNKFRVALVDEPANGIPNAGGYITSERLNSIYNYKNMVEILPSWIAEVKLDAKESYSSFVSSNYYEAIFDSLLLEIDRTESEKTIVASTKEELDVPSKYTYILGHRLNVKENPEEDLDETEPDQLDLKLYQIHKILPEQNQIIKKIGVWGRPGLAMAINGQKIEIGPSGVFEFEGLDITSFGVFAEGVEDKFVVDYQYITTQ